MNDARLLIPMINSQTEKYVFPPKVNSYSCYLRHVFVFYRVAFVVGGDLIKCSSKILFAPINFNNGNVSFPPPSG